MTTEEFIEKAKKVHGEKYDYSNVKYKKMVEKVCIICPEHGEFWQTPDKHLRTSGCNKCQYELRAKKQTSTTEEFIEKAKKIHGDKFDYSKVEYKKSSEKVCIICPEHGEFWQTPNSHLSKSGCPKCGNILIHQKFATTQDEFIKKANTLHNNKYDYSKVEYVNSGTKICIICPEHGEFWQTPGHHLSGQGCPKCRYINMSKKQQLTIEEFIERGNVTHNNKYDYSKVDYKGYETKVCIICPEHGEIWQTPDSHLHSGGCPKCGKKYSKAEEEIIDYIKEKKPNILIETKNRTILGDNYEIDIYFPELKIGIEYDGLLWHSEKYEKYKDYHINKTIKANKRGVKLIHIFEDEYQLNKELTLNKILHILNMSDNKPKIYARKCTIRKIDVSTTQNFLNKNHIQGFVRATIHLGCFFEDKLIAVMSFMEKRLNTNIWKLVRYATDYQYICIGTGGKLFSTFLKEYNPTEIISFADRRWTLDKDNNLYTKLGFKLDKILQPDYRYYCKKYYGERRIHKFNFRKKTLHKKFGFPMTMTENEMTTKLNVYKIWDCGLFKYVWKKM